MAHEQPSVTGSLERPRFGQTLVQDMAAATNVLRPLEHELHDIGAPAERTPEARLRANSINAEIRKVKEGFFRRHAAEMYDELTKGCTIHRRLSDLLYDAADHYPGMLPTRAQIAGERSYMKQFVKDGLEIEQGLFTSYIFANERCGRHLIHAMLRPKPESETRLAQFRKTGFLDLGRATVERRDNIGQVTLTNADFLNAEDDPAVNALEIAADLLLLDDQVQVCVLRGGKVQHPKYAGRRVFNAGINLTHLFYGQIGYVEFILERELGLLSKMYRGLWMSDTCEEQFEDYQEKPWLAVVDSFAIGGGCQLLCIMDRVIAERGSYFNLPASKEGFIPGAANLRLPRLVGIHLARHGIFFDKVFHADTPEGMMICDEVVPPEEMDEAAVRNALGMLNAGFTSAVSNRKALRVGQEPLDVFRRYMATYSRQQALCFYDPALIANLEKSWQPQSRKM
jgi:(3,5-dihydroxyphenyl)acetyl-CoA 1,2-dioxygenase